MADYEDVLGGFVEQTGSEPPENRQGRSVTLPYNGNPP